MTLYKACKIALSKGLQTVDEAVDNIILHQNIIFTSSEDIHDEINELRYELLTIPKDTKISVAFPCLCAATAHK